MRPPLLAVFFAVVLFGCAALPKEVKSSFVGDYYSPQPCSLGSEVDLSLRADGSYRMIRTLPEGVGPKMPEGERAGFEELGLWGFDGTLVVLKPGGGKRMKLKPEYREGVLILADAEIIGLRLEKQKPNQTLQPTRG